MDAAAIEYLAEQHCARQWKGFLRILAEELAQQMPDAERRAFLRRLGERFARAQPLPACATLDELQLAMGRAWIAQDWGWVALDEQPGHLRIRHQCAPLFAAFGEQAAGWSPAFLEGVYQEWFRQADAGAGLRVSHAAGPDAAGSAEFRLEAAA